MGLSSALYIGRSGLLAHQAAIQAAGNNLANMSTPGYHRQAPVLSPNVAQEIKQGVYVGTGVAMSEVTRLVDYALESRLRSAIGDQSRQSARMELLSQVEAIENELSGVDLSTRLSEFFNSWSELANNPQDASLRTLVLQESANLAGFVQDLRGEYAALVKQSDTATGNGVATVNDLLAQIEDLNQRISVQSRGVGDAPNLRDQRDQLLSELSQYLDISVNENDRGVVDVFVGSLPIVLDGKSRGVELVMKPVDGEMKATVVVAADQSPLDVSSGKLGALIEFRRDDLQTAIDTIDTFAHTLIFEINKLHSSGQGVDLLGEVTSTAQIDDATLALNDPDAGLEFDPVHGSFMIHLTQKSTGQRESQLIQIDLDGIGADTSLNDLAAAINAVNNVSATITADGRLQITPASGDYGLSFSEDSSGILAAIGINTLYDGNNAYDIAVNADMMASPNLLAAAQGHLAGDNSTALAIAGLRTTGLDELNGLSLTEYWTRHVEDFAIRTGQAREATEAALVVVDNLQAQQQSFSGVNADEETISLMQYQRAYQASARFITVVDELMQTLMSLV